MFQENVSLSTYSNIKIGGEARYFAVCTTQEELEAALSQAKRDDLEVRILGGATNILINDSGISGLVIKPDIKGIEAVGHDQLRVGAGVSVAQLTAYATQNALSGFEWAGGLPGTVGGAIWGNAGAWGGEIKDNLVEVTSLNMATLKVITRNNIEAHFSYRSSIFKEQIAAHPLGGEVILSAVFQMKPGDQATIAALTKEKEQYRINKQPLEYPNIGSIFKNTDIKKVPEAVVARFKEKIKSDPFPVLPTAVLNAAAGLKGRRVGGAMLSEKHSNFIVNAGGATAADVKELMGIIAETVKKGFGVELEQEIIFW